MYIRRQDEPAALVLGIDNNRIESGSLKLCKYGIRVALDRVCTHLYPVQPFCVTSGGLFSRSHCFLISRLL